MNPVERRYLLVSVFGNLFMAVLGLCFAYLTDSQAILLDGLFDATYLIAGLFTLKVSALVHLVDDDRFPYGYAHFEPLVNGVKGLLVLGISLAALAGAVDSLLAGGREILAGMATLYAIIAAAGCAALALVVRGAAKRTGSPLLRADADNWIVNSAISACVVVAFAAIVAVRGTALAFFAPYIDPFVVVLVVLFTLSVPVRMAWRALMELLNRAPGGETEAQVRGIIETSLAGLPVEELFVRVIQPGRTRMVLAHAVLPASHRVDSLSSLDAVRAIAEARLREAHLATILDLVFTADRRWGAPTAIPASPLGASST